MYKLILVIVLAAFMFGLYALQLDREIAVEVLFQIKHSVNRASHAAAQMVDGDQLAGGIAIIDVNEARSSAIHYLRENLQLDDQMLAAQGGFIAGEVEVPVFEVINQDVQFPYLYTNAKYDYEVTLYKPGVIMIVKAEYQRLFQVIGPITWFVKGAAEVIY